MWSLGCPLLVTIRLHLYLLDIPSQKQPPRRITPLHIVHLGPTLGYVCEALRSGPSLAWCDATTARKGRTFSLPREFIL